MYKKGLSRILSMALAAVLAVSILGQQTVALAAGTAAAAGSRQNVPWGNGLTTDLENGVLTIEGSNIWVYEHNLSVYGGEKANITTVNIGEGIIGIDKNTFEKLPALTKVSLPSSLQSIGARAFADCSQLEDINIPAGVTSIGKEAFLGTEWVKQRDGLVAANGKLFEYVGDSANVIVPSGIQEICEGAFQDNQTITSVIIPSGMSRIGRCAFQGCAKLESINIPVGVTSIGASAFQGCVNINNISLPAGITSIENNLFMGCPNLENISIPAGVTSIGSDAFYGCKSLSTISLPAGITDIGAEAFYDCDRLGNILFGNTDSIKTVGNNAFYNTQWIGRQGKFVVLNHILVDYQGGEKEIVLPNDIVEVNYGALSYTSAESIKFNANLKKIKKDGVSYNPSLKAVTVPGSVSEIGYHAFAYCTALETVVIEEGVKSIDDVAFADDLGLKEIRIPRSVTGIGRHAIGYRDEEAGSGKVSIPPIIYCYLDSAAYRYALDNAIPYRFLDEIVEDKDVKVQSISLSDSQFAIKRGQTYRLQATVWPADAGNKDIKWTSDNPAIAVVDSHGLVIAVNEGQTRIWAASKDGSGISTSCTVSVLPKDKTGTTLANGVLTIEGTGAVGPADLYLYELNKANITSVVIGGGITEIGDYTFRDYTALESMTIPSSVVRIGYHAIGYVRNANTGLDIIGTKLPTIYCYNNSAAHQYALAHGLPYRLWDAAADVKVTKISLTQTNPTMQLQGVLTLNAVVTPWNATNKTLRWSSSNHNVVTVNNYGEVVAVGVGTAVVTASSTDGSGVSASSVITVYPWGAATGLVERISLDKVATSLETGQSLWLQADVYPAGAANKVLNWTSSNPSVAMAYSNGYVAAVGAGTAVITVSSTDGSGASASCVVTVWPRETLWGKVERITLDRASCTVDVGQSFWLQADVYPVGAANKTLNWTSSNPTVATVSAQGLVTASSAGMAVVTATSTDGSGVSGYCVVTVQRRQSNLTPSTPVNPTPAPTQRPTTTAPIAPDQGVNAVKYIVCYNANGGTNLSQGSITLSENERLGALPTVQRSGYEFIGWYTLPNGGTRVTSDTVLNKAATLYARWERESVPERVTGLTLKAKKDGVLVVKFAKVSGATGYQVVYSTSQYFGESETKTVGTKSAKVSIRKLKKGTTYYVKVRAYEMDAEGNRVYGPFSTIKNVTAK